MSAVTAPPLNPIQSQTTATATVDTPGPGGQVLTVGVGMEFATLSDAIAACHDNDVIAVQAGTYVDAQTDVQKNVILAKNVTIEGVGGMVHLVMGPQGIINGKALIVAENGLTLKNFELSGASDGNPDNNLAGVRCDGGSLVLQNDYIHDNQDGVLGGVAGTTITIDHCEVANNGSGSGYTHNIYTGNVDTLTITNSYIHGAVVGHEIKSRAATTIIQNNIIADGATGTGSYDIDIPNAGVALISGNVIEKGPAASNAGIIHYGGETQFSYATNSLTVTGNTILNDYGANAGLVWNQSATNGLTVTASVTGNSLYGITPANYGTGLLAVSNNTTLTSEPTYATPSPYLGGPVIQPFTGPLTLVLTNSGHSVSGGAVALTITDQAGGNAIASGTGVGISLTENGSYSGITTSAGTASTIVLNGSGNTLASAGNDSITIGGLYNSVTASGASTIVSNLFGSITLNGAETLIANGPANVTVGNTGTAVITVTQAYLSVVKAASGSLTLIDTVTPTNMRVSVLGGAVTAFASGSGITLAANDALGDTVTFGTGQTAITLGAGADTLVFINGQGGGTNTITGFKVGTDSLSLQGFGGNPIQASSISGGNTYVTLTDGTSIVLNGVQVSGSGLVPVAPPPPQSYVLTSSGQTITGAGLPITVTDQSGGNTINGGVGGMTATINGSGSIVTTAAGSSNTVTLAYQSTLTSAGTDTITITGAYNTVSASGNATVTLGFYNNSVTGGAGTLGVTDNFGSNVITGGAGGLTAQVNGQYSVVSTVASATDTITVTGRDTVNSLGTDTINVGGNYNTITASGTTTINVAASSFNTLTLNGVVTVNDAGGGSIIVGAAGNVAVTATTAYVAISKAAGGQLTLTDALAATTASATVTGGAVTGFANTAGITLASTDSAGNTVTFGTGQTTVTVGSGADTLLFINGQGGGTDIINGFRLGTDQLRFQGFTGYAVSTSSISGGNTYVTLTDGTSVILNGVQLTSTWLHPATPQTYVLTATGQTITGGDGLLTVTDQAGGNTITGGNGGMMATINGSGSIVTTAAGSSNTVTLAYQSTLTSAGTDTITITGAYNTVSASGNATVTLGFYNNSVTGTGAAGTLTVTDNAGGNTITGGAGGLTAQINGQYSVVSTLASATDTIAVTGRDTVNSRGTDTINVGGNYNTITASGTTTINVAAGSFNTLRLNGAETLNDAGGGLITIGAAATAVVNASTTYVSITKAAGGTVAVSQQPLGGSAPATAVVTGGAATIQGGTGQTNTLVITTTAGANDAITLGAGSSRVTSLGNDTVVGGSGTVSITAGTVSSAAMSFIAGSGAASIVAGAGLVNATGGAGKLSLRFGSGTANVHLGKGAANLLSFAAGSGGGNDTVWGYRAGLDKAQFTGVKIATQGVVGGNLQLTLSDGTHATFMGVTHL